ncbi:MAG: right-handed parallel beta-helix repeat-containing protein [Clostridium sp.]
MKRLKAVEWGIYPNTKEDQMLKLNELLKVAKLEEVGEIEFEAGEYHFYPEYAPERVLYISNHDEDGLKRIAFILEEVNNLTIKGNETNFKFHTDIIPFYIESSKNITVKGITIDYERPIYSEGEILEVNKKSMIIAIDKNKYPYEINHKRIYFIGENFKKELTHFLEMDYQDKRPAYNTKDVFFNLDRYGLSAEFEELQEGVVKIQLVGESTFELNHTVKNKLILRHHPRSHPGFYVKDSETICLKNITVHHSSGMAFIAQHTKDITLDKFSVKINLENERIFTANADATHFVYCYGKIMIQNCLFENQLDDPVNIHGIYSQVNQVISPTEIIVKLVHEQQKGVRIGKKGERINLIDNETMEVINENTIKSIRVMNKEYILIELEEICDSIQVGYAVENKEYIPDVTIKNCIMRNNRARGCLLTSAGKVIVENNYISTPGAGILIEGDANYWFESGGTNEIIIRNNIFDNCAYVMGWGQAPIQITPVVKKVVGDSRYHKKICIEDNRFNCFDERLIFARSVVNLVFTGNEISKNNKFEELGSERFILKDVIEFVEKNNLFE